MYRIPTRPLLLLGLLSAATMLRPATLAAQPRPPAESPAELAERVEELVKAEMERQEIPGLSLAVAKEGHLVLAKGFGLANLELGVPATPQTVYQIQSMTKSFTATGIMMLVEQDKVRLDDRVSKHLAANC